MTRLTAAAMPGNEISREVGIARAGPSATGNAVELEAGGIEADRASLRFHALSFEDGIGETLDAPCPAADGHGRPLLKPPYRGAGHPSTATADARISWGRTIHLLRPGAPVAKHATTNGRDTGPARQVGRW